MSMIVYLFNLQLEEVTSLLLQRRSTVGQLMELVMAFCKDRAALTKKSSKGKKRKEKRPTLFQYLLSKLSV